MKLVDSPRKCKNPEPVCVRLILVEEDAMAFEPPQATDVTEQAALEVVMLVQSPGEAGADFVDRTLRRVAALERADRTITEAVIAAGPHHDKALVDTRTLNARSVLAHMVRAGRGEIVLMAGAAPQEERHEFLALAGTLACEATGDVTIRVLFDEPRAEPERKSGIQALLTGGRRSHDVADALAAG